MCDYSAPSSDRYNPVEETNLPPITTQLADCFPESRPGTQASSELHPSKGVSASLKRKRSNSPSPKPGTSFPPAIRPWIGANQSHLPPLETPLISAASDNQSEGKEEFSSRRISASVSEQDLRSPKRVRSSTTSTWPKDLPSMQAVTAPRLGEPFGHGQIFSRVSPSGPFYGEPSQVASPETSILPPLINYESSYSHSHELGRSVDTSWKPVHKPRIPAMEPSANYRPTPIAESKLTAKNTRYWEGTSLRTPTQPGSIREDLTTPRIAYPPPTESDTSYEYRRAPVQGPPSPSAQSLPTERRLENPAEVARTGAGPFYEPSNTERSVSYPQDPSNQYTFDPSGGADSFPKNRRRGNLPKGSTRILNDWFHAHSAYPYPKEEEKERLQHQTGLTMSQISNWFINARRRRRPDRSITDRTARGPMPEVGPLLRGRRSRYPGSHQ